MIKKSLLLALTFVALSFTSVQGQNLGDASIFGFETSTTSWAQTGSIFAITTEKYNGSFASLKCVYAGQSTTNNQMVLPAGAISLTSGTTYIVSAKIWIDPTSTLSTINFLMGSTLSVSPVDITGVTKGQWETISIEKLGDANTAGTAVKFGIRVKTTTTEAGTFYIDDISITEKGTTTSLNNKTVTNASAFFDNASKSIVVKGADVKNVVLYNLTGKQVRTVLASSETTSFSTTGLPKGIYLVKINSEVGTSTKKIQIQ